MSGMELSSGSRNAYLDNIKGYLIFLVVIGHIIEPMLITFDIAKKMYMLIYIFHMPMFTVISGYLSSRDSKPGDIKKHIYRILLPFIILQIILLAIKYANDSDPTTIK